TTNKPLAEASAVLEVEGVALRYLNLLAAPLQEAVKPLTKQEEGTHADEIETSLMLYLKRDVVDLQKAPVDHGPGARPRRALSPHPNAPRPSVTGIYGDATLASYEKGKVLAEAIVKHVIEDVEALRRAAPPEPLSIYAPNI